MGGIEAGRRFRLVLTPGSTRKGRVWKWRRTSARKRRHAGSMDAASSRRPKKRSMSIRKSSHSIGIAAQKAAVHYRLYLILKNQWLVNKGEEVGAKPPLPYRSCNKLIIELRPHFIGCSLYLFWEYIDES
jgi:hypothetical protein